MASDGPSETGASSAGLAVAGDSAWLEAQYNMRIRHPERAAIYAGYRRESARLRAELPCRLDLRYGDGPRATLDLFPAERQGPLLLFVHGGYWRALDKAMFSFVAAPFVADGIAVALMNYDLAPAVTLDTVVEQTREAVGWLLREGEAYGVAPHGMVVAGHSAGGHLAVTALATDWAARGLPTGGVRAALSISGLFELEPLLGTSINADVRLDREAARRLSLRNMVGAHGGALALFVGGDESEEFRRQTVDFCDTWCAAGFPGQAEIVPGRNHFTVIGDLADAGTRIYRAARDLVRNG